MNAIAGNYGRTVEMPTRVKAYALMANKGLKSLEKMTVQTLYSDSPVVKLELSEEGKESLREYIRKQEGGDGPEITFQEYPDRLKEGVAKAPETEEICEKPAKSLSGTLKPRAFRNNMWAFYSEMADSERLIKEEQQTIKEEREQRIEMETFLEELDEKVMTVLRDFAMQYVRESISDISKVLGNLDY